jgi:hypothetical protein
MAVSLPPAAPARSEAERAEAREAQREAGAILRERRFQPASVPRPLRRPLEVIGVPIVRAVGWLGDRVPGGSPFLWVLASTIVVLGAFLAAGRLGSRRTRGRLRARDATSAAAPGETPARLEREAERAERDGDLARALRVRFRAGLLRLQASGALVPRPSLTSGEITRRLGSPTFAALARTFDEVAYGGRRPEPADIDAARSGWTRVLAEAGAR